MPAARALPLLPGMMNGRMILPLALSFAGLTLAMGCTREKRNDTGETTTTTGASMTSVSNDIAVSRIVASRCAREAACNNVGASKHFQNAEGCTSQIRSDMKDDLNAKDCPHGVDAKELDECLSAIRAEDCKNPIDTITRLTACRTGDLCRASAVPTR